MKTWNSQHHRSGELEYLYQLNENKNMNRTFTWSALFASKTVWFNVIMTVIGYISYLQSVAHFDKYAVLMGSILALGNLILKIWFNNVAIASTPTN